VVQRIGEEMNATGQFDEGDRGRFGSVIGRIGDGPVKIVYDSPSTWSDVGDPES
jgi:hypothetical protein